MKEPWTIPVADEPPFLRATNADISYRLWLCSALLVMQFVLGGIAACLIVLAVAKYSLFAAAAGVVIALTGRSLGDGRRDEAELLGEMHRRKRAGTW